ncbi:MAG TPA: hypothetical protein VIG24_03975 [Acidimicrobiia bacterium]
MSIYGTTFMLDRESDHGAPYVYVGSHRTANPKFRGGAFDIAEVVPWCSLEPYLRLSMNEAEQRWTAADILIDVKQAEALRDYLTGFIERVESGEWRQWGDEDLRVIGTDEPIDKYLSRYVATDADWERMRERRKSA